MSRHCGYGDQLMRKLQSKNSFMASLSEKKGRGYGTEWKQGRGEVGGYVLLID